MLVNAQTLTVGLSVRLEAKPGRETDLEALLRGATVWVNRLNQPPEELGLHPDRTVTDLNGLLDFVLEQSR
jgi:hypothetical protein